MRVSSILIVLIGFGVAGGSVYAARDYLEMQAKAGRDGQMATVAVLVAARDIALGQTIEPHMITTQDWPVDSVPPGVFTDSAMLLPDPGEQPRRAMRAIAQGELLTANRVSDWGEKVTIAQTLAEGTRAMAISVDAQTAVGGFVTPGDFVDIVLTQGGGEELRAVTILQNIRIIGVDQDASEQTDAPSVARTVTVEVTPDQGQRVALAQQAGKLSLSLRDPNASVDEALPAINLSDLLMIEKPAPVEVSAPAEAAPEPAPIRRSIVVRRAGVPTTEDY
ncbi:pilus assembly protein [Rubellimicrobium mesophilum DSM 19309]|uniref:Pilus assembly protein n=1 Tax=Rubellimicrobium mesophilum DSM 19309 TaxID=442562 RepID=A0A017HSH9_9RHOB|nr:Flp pilus assembly protein CpaB [Rubellimicrobium mesophilum]EYD76709.1 pilus assembly protein [Rubellimicrobium mesophilum DSM 19309]